MPEDEIEDKVYNFFDEDNLSQDQHQLQVTGGNPGVYNSNRWAGGQRQIGPPLTSKSTNYSVQQSDSGIRNIRQSRIPLGTEFTQLPLRSEFAKGQSRNQHLTLNGFTQGHQGFETRQHQAEFLGRGNGPEHSSGLNKTSGGLETAKAPRNFDFLGAQHLLMRGQQSGLPQPRPRQQTGFNDSPQWEQQLRIKQLQELERLQQLQQFNQTKQQNPVNQLNSIAKQTAGGQLPALVNGTPVLDSSNYLWPNEHISGDSKMVPSSSQLFMVGGMNLVQQSGSPSMHALPNGVMFSNEQGLALRSTGFVPQQLDQSLYGASIASTGGNLNPYPNIQGFSHESADLLNKTQVEKLLIQSSSLNNSFQGDQRSTFQDQVCMQDGALVSKQGLQGKGLFGNRPGQGLSREVLTGNIQQLNSVPKDLQVQELLGRHERPGWLGNLQEKTIPQVGPSQGLVALDPTEERILFNSDDVIWDASSGRSNNMSTGVCGNPLEGPDFFGSFPSIQSGSWSALMQSAVAETSSSDTGLQEEWSGLSFQNIELPTGNHSASFNDTGKRQTSWVDGNLQTAPSLTSRSFPSFDASTTPINRNIAGFQPSGVKSLYEQNVKVRYDSSHESVQQPSNESGKGIDRSPQHKPHVEGSHQLQSPMHLHGTPDGTWNGQSYEQSETVAHSADAESNSQKIRGSWAYQQNISSHNMGSHPCNKPNGWNMDESLSPNGDAVRKAHKNAQILQNSQSSDYQRAVQADRDHNSLSWNADGNAVSVPFCNSASGLEQIKSGTGSPNLNSEGSQMNNFSALPDSGNIKRNHEINPQVPHSHPFNYGNRAFNSSLKYYGNESAEGYQHQLSNVPQVRESSSNNSERASGESYDNKHDSSFQKEISDNSYNSTQPRRIVTGGVNDAWINPNDSNSLAGADQKSLGQIGRKTSGTRKFQYHPMGSLGMNMEHVEAVKRVTHSHAFSQQVTDGLKGQEKGYLKSVGHIPNNAMDIDKGRVAELDGSMEKSEETSSRGIMPGYGSNMSASLGGPSGFHASNRTAQPSQNMLELLHKVDQSREQAPVNQFVPSDRNQSFEMPEAEATETFAAHLRRTQSSASQGFVLRLAPPSQRLPVSSHSLPSWSSSQVVNDHDSRHGDPEEAERGQSCLNSPVPPRALSHSREILQRELGNNKAGFSGQTGSESSLCNMQGKSGAFTSALPYPKNQFPSQGGQIQKDHSVNGPFDSLACRLTQRNSSHDRVASDQSAQSLLPGSSGRVAPFSLGSPADTSQSVSSTSSYLRVSGQQLPALEPVSVSQPLVTSGMSQQGAFSKMLHNVWNNVSRQSQSAGQPQKVHTTLVPSISSSDNNLETTLRSQKSGDQDVRRGVNSSLAFGARCINPQLVSHGKNQPTKESSWQQVPSERAEPAQQTAVGSQDSLENQSLAGNTIASSPLLAQRNQQEIDRRNGKDPLVVLQAEHPSIQNPPSSNRDVEMLGRSLPPSNNHPNYSLLHQMQVMKGVETSPSQRVSKRFKGPDFGPDGQQASVKAGQQLPHGYNTMVGAADNGQKPAGQHCSLSSGDTKMLSFSSDMRGNANASVSSQLTPQDMVTIGRNESQNQSNNMSIPSTRAEHSKISPQMAPSWFEQYGTFKNGQMLPMYDARRSAKAAAHQYFFKTPSESLPTHTQIEQLNVVDSSQVSNTCTTSTVVVSERSSPVCSLPPVSTDQIVATVRPKKRKSATSGLLPWHKEVTQGSQRLHNISVAELDWAQAANRLIEKAEEEAETIEDVQPLVRPRRRIILTTQLIQQLFRPAPASILSADVTSNYESLIYFIAKLALGDACSLSIGPGSGSLVSPANTNIATEKIDDQHFSKAVEHFIGRLRELENDLLRLDKRASILDLRVDCQDLEGYSVMNRFAKFHGRSNADGAETSSSSEAGLTPQKTFPQRYVTALPMPRNLPNGVQCLLL